MARAKRHYIPGHIWHITHRCHKGEFLLKFARDRKRWLQWLFKAERRYGLSVLNYMITSNHIHLLVIDDCDRDVIPKSMQLVAGRIGQEYNKRKSRKGAFWEDRYHATAVEKGRHLLNCIVYIDTNMVRAGVVNHPAEWSFCGYNEIQEPRNRKSLIAYDKLSHLLDFESYDVLKAFHRDLIEGSIETVNNVRDSKWTQSIAVGSNKFIEQTKADLGIRAKGRRVRGHKDVYELREPRVPYGDDFDLKKGDLMLENTYFWNTFPEISIS